MVGSDGDIGDPRDTELAIVDDCERCEQKELCPIYMGEHCLLKG